MKRKYLKCLIVITGIFLVLFISNKIMKSKYNDLPEVRLKEIVNKDKSFAIMIQNETGYEEYDSNTWPGEEYVYKEAKCTDNNGALVEDVIVFADGKATLTTTQTVYCTLYFDIKKESIVDILKEKSDGKLTDELVYGLYRYQGNAIISNHDAGVFDREDTVKNNYICLGADCNEDGKDLYRIIGVTEDGLLKVVKNVPANDSIAWNSDSSSDIKWPQSELYQYLNSEFYNTLSIDLKEMIVNSEWKYGDISNIDFDEENQNIFTPKELEKYHELSDAIYGTEENDYESGLNDDQKREKIKEISKLESEALVKRENELTDNVTANIGLLTLTDYCSSFESNSIYNCMISKHYYILDEAKNEDFVVSWLSSQRGWGADWTMSRIGLTDYDFYAWSVSLRGHVDGGWNVGSELPVRPVFYLKFDLDISGVGTLDDPFRIGIE